jgi:PIN domain
MAGSRFVNVFLDTQFFDSNQLDLANKTFEVLRSAVAAGHLHVFSTEVTRREVERHVRERAAKLHERLESVRRDSFVRNLTRPPFDALHAAPTRQDIEKALLDQLADCWSDLRTTTLPIAGANVTTILDDYFNARPPFGPGKKKSEFPDAFAAQALQAWCRQNEQPMHVISGDGDWKAVCDAVPSLIHKFEIAEILASFPDATASKAIRDWLSANKDLVQKAIIHAFKDYLFFVKKRYKGELRTVDVVWVRIDDAYVIQLQNGVAAVELPCKIAYRFVVAHETPDTPYAVVSRLRNRIYEGKSKTKVVIEMAVRYDVANPDNKAIESVSVAARS